MNTTNLKLYCREIGRNFVANLDNIFSIITIFTGLIIIYLSLFAGIGQYGLGLAFLVSPFGYYVLKKRLDIPIEKSENNDENKYSTFFLANNIIYFTLFCLSIIILWNTVYYRPAIYFYIITIAYFTLFVEILYRPNDRMFTSFIMIKTLLLSLSYRFGRYYIFPTIPGNDTHAHISTTKYIIADGNINGLLTEFYAPRYFYTPLWHIYESISRIIMDIGFKEVLFFTIVFLFLIITSLFIYLIAKKIFNEEIALIAFILANIVDMLFVRGVTNINTGSFVHIFIVITLYCLIQYKNKPIYSFFSLLFMVCSILTHQLSTAAFLIIIFSLYMGKILYTYLYTNINLQNHISIKLNTVVFFFIVILFYWSTMGYVQKTTFFAGMVSRLETTISDMINEYLSSGQAVSTNYGEMFSQFSFLSNLLYNFGYSMLIGLAILGILILLNRRFISEIYLSYICVALILFLLIYPGTFIGLNYLFIPHRFISHLEIFLVMFASLSIYYIYTLSNTNKEIFYNANKILAALIVVVLIFFMITTPYVNRADPLYEADRVQRTEYTHSELKSIEWNNYHQADKELMVDPLVEKRPISTVERINTSGIQLIKYPKNVYIQDISSNILIRQYARNNPYLISRGTFGTTKIYEMEFLLNIVPEECNNIYSNNLASVYRSKYI
ncbi:glycosyltransferase family 39 protein [Methanohalophilus mahii]|nr:glycosyltransferase family 39 protein [Methanohalophilus mahii]